MSFTIKTKALKEYIGILQGVAGKDGLLEFSNSASGLVECSAVGEGCKVTLEFNAEAVEIDGKFTPFAVNSSAIGNSIKLLKNEDVKFTPGDTVAMQSGRSKFKLTTYGLSAVPCINDVDANDAVAVLSSAALELLIDRVWYAAGKDEARPSLCGINLSTDKDRLVSMATDGVRLARYSVRCPNGFYMSDSITMSNEAIKQVRKFLSTHKEDHQTRLIVGENRAKVVTDYGSVLFTLIDGEFPDCSTMFPELTTSVDLDTDKFSSSIDRLLVVADEKKINAVGDGNELVMTSGHGNLLGEERIEFSGDTELLVPFAFNGQFMRDALKCEMIFDFAPDRAIVMRGLVDTDYMAIVMPMRV